MKAVPIPGEILRTDVFLGLTFNELITLGSLPLVLVFPSLFIDQIPLVASLGLALLFALGVVAIVLQTPEGQTPLEWAPAAAKRRLTPDTYYLKPRHRKRDELRHLDVVQTADLIHDESLPDEEHSESAAEDVDRDGGVTTTLNDALPVGDQLFGDDLEAGADSEDSPTEEADDRSARVPAIE